MRARSTEKTDGSAGRPRRTGRAGYRDGAFDPVAGRDELLERAQLGQRGGNRREYHASPRIQRLDAEGAAARHQRERWIDEPHVPARVAPGVFVVRGEQRAAMRVERGDEGFDGIGHRDIVDRAADPDASPGLVLVRAHGRASSDEGPTPGTA
jgi:hypothetical protein